MWGTPIPALIVSAGVLALVIVRQGVIFLEQVRLRRERAAAQVRELALCFSASGRWRRLSTHGEPRTEDPAHRDDLASAIGTAASPAPETFRGAVMPPDVVQVVHRCEQDLHGTEAQLKRQGRLIDELLDVSRIRVGRLDLHREPGDLQDHRAWGGRRATGGMARAEHSALA